MTVQQRKKAQCFLSELSPHAKILKLCDKLHTFASHTGQPTNKACKRVQSD